MAALSPDPHDESPWFPPQSWRPLHEPSQRLSRWRRLSIQAKRHLPPPQPTQEEDDRWLQREAEQQREREAERRRAEDRNRHQEQVAPEAAGRVHDRRLFAAARDLIAHAFPGRPTKEACRQRARSLKAEGAVETITKGLEALTQIVEEIRPTVQARLERDRPPLWRNIHWKVNHNPEAVHAELARRREEREEARRSRIRAERAARKAMPKTKWQRIWEIVTGPDETVLVHDPRGARLRALKIESERKIVGWQRNRYGSKPIYGDYRISRHDAIRFFIDRKKRERAERRRKERAKRTDPEVERKRKEEIRAAHALKLSVAEYRRMTDEERVARERRCKWEDQRRRHNALRDALLDHANGSYHLLAIRAQIEVLKRYPQLALTAVWELYDLRKAHPNWLDAALAAAEANIWLRGRAYRWYRSGEIEFYEFLRIALKVRRRHEYTNYDDLLDEGVDRDTARRIMNENDPEDDWEEADGADDDMDG